MKQHIPNLRHDAQEFTLEHCSVILEKAKANLLDWADQDTLDSMSHVDSQWMRDELLQLFSQQSLVRLFETEFGKGAILGLFLFILSNEYGQESEP